MFQLYKICLNSFAKAITYNFNGELLTSEGIYFDTVQSSMTCDTIFELTLSTLNPSSSQISDQICAGDSYDFNGELLSAEGSYIDTINNAVGCDSIITLSLSVINSPRHSFSTTICENEIYDFNGENLMDEGIYYDTLSTPMGCDSIIELEVFVLENTYADITAEICNGEDYNFNGELISAEGIYTDTLSAQNGCDSIVTLDLSITSVMAFESSAFICPGDTYNFNGELLENQGIYNDTLITGTGCDSLIILNLAFYPQSFETEFIDLCEGEVFTINGVNYNQDTSFSDMTFTGTECLLTTYEVALVPETFLEVTDYNACPEDNVNILINTNGPIAWSSPEFLSCDDCPNPIATVSETTSFTVSTTACNGDPIEEIITVFISDTEELIIDGADALVLGNGSTWTAASSQQNEVVDWYFNNELVCEACVELNFTPPSSGNLTIRPPANSTRCYIEATKPIKVDNDCSQIGVQIPNIITPNNDGANETLRIALDNYAKFIIFRIYDRWGGLMFETNDPSFSWDGTFESRPLNPGVYSYYLEVICLNESVTIIKGNVTLLR